VRILQGSLINKPTLAQAKKILKLAKKNSIKIVSSSEYAKYLLEEEKRKNELERRTIAENSDEEFDFLKEKELLEWSRSRIRPWLGMVSLGKKDWGKIPTF